MHRWKWSALAVGGLSFLSANAMADEPKVVRARVVNLNDNKNDDKEIGVFVVEDDDAKPKTAVVRRFGKALSAGAAAAAKETYLGVVTEAVPAVLAAQMPKVLVKDQGLVVTKALDKSPAAKAGLRANDVIATLGDQKIFNSEQLKKLVCAEKPGASVELGIIREGKLIEVSATLEERPISAFALALDGKPGDLQWLSKGDKDAQRNIEIIRKQAIDKARSAVDAARGKANEAREKARSIQLELQAKAEHEAHKARDAAEHAEEAARDAHRKAIAIYRDALQSKEGKHGGDSKNKKIALSITVDNNSAPKVAVEFTDNNGKEIVKKFEGKLDELEGKLKELPSDIADKVRQALKGMHMDGKGSISIGVGDKKGGGKAGGKGDVKAEHRIRVIGDADIKSDDGKGAFRFRLGKPDGTALLKSIDFDVDLDLKDIMKQLGDLGPEVKAEVEKALKNVKVPKVDVSVEKSQ